MQLQSLWPDTIWICTRCPWPRDYSGKWSWFFIDKALVWSHSMVVQWNICSERSIKKVVNWEVQLLGSLYTGDNVSSCWCIRHEQSKQLSISNQVWDRRHVEAICRHIQRDLQQRLHRRRVYKAVWRRTKLSPLHLLWVLTWCSLENNNWWAFTLILKSLESHKRLQRQSLYDVWQLWLRLNVLGKTETSSKWRSWGLARRCWCCNISCLEASKKITAYESIVWCFNRRCWSIDHLLEFDNIYFIWLVLSKVRYYLGSRLAKNQ